jgi:hypothetical protein
MRTFARLLRKFLAESISLLRQSKERKFDLVQIDEAEIVRVMLIVSISVSIFRLKFEKPVSKLLEPLLDAFEFRHVVASFLIRQTIIIEPLDDIRRMPLSSMNPACVSSVLRLPIEFMY